MNKYLAIFPNFSVGYGLMARATYFMGRATWIQWLATRFLNSLRSRQNGRHFADDSLKCILLNENVWISLKISLKFVPEVRINYIPALVQLMAWHLPGNKPLSEAMMVSLPMHICVTWPQWVKAWSEGAWSQLVGGSGSKDVYIAIFGASYFWYQCDHSLYYI